MENLAVVLHTRPLSSSIKYRSYSEQLGGKALIGWWVERFSIRLPSVRLYILCHSDRDEAEINSILNGAITIIGAKGSTLGDFSNAAEQTRSTDIAFVDYGFAFAPYDLLTRVYAHHLRHGNTYTPVRGFPVGTVPEVYNSDSLAELRGAYRSGMPSAPSEMVQRLLSASHALGRPCPIRLRAVPFDAASSYGVSASEAPESIAMETADEVEIARRVLNLSISSSDEFKLWRQCSITMRNERRDELLNRKVGRFHPISRGLPYRILFISNPSGFSGAEESLCQLIAHLDTTRFRLLALIGRDGIFADRLRDMGVEVTSPGHGFDSSSPENTVYLIKLLMTLHPDLVHFNAESGPSVVAASLLLRIPMVAHCRNSVLAGDEELFKTCDQIIAVSEFAKRQALKLEIPQDRVRVIYDEVDSQKFCQRGLDRNRIRKHFGIREDLNVVLMIARFVPHKRHDVMLKAAELTKKAIPELHLILKGDLFANSETYDGVRRYIQAHGMERWVSIIRFVNDIRQIHAAADVVVLCSDGEALGRCIVEAMSMKRPVIVTDSGGTHEIIQNGKTGFVVPGNDPNALSDKIVMVLRDRGLGKRVASAARRYVQKHLQARDSAKTMMVIYEELIASNRKQLQRLKKSIGLGSDLDDVSVVRDPIRQTIHKDRTMRYQGRLR
jgi:glycosyltransferase involved in cell wall biosynthesis